MSEAPRTGLGPLEGRLYLVALLAGGYVFAWRALSDPISEVARPQPVVWFDEVPGDRRPALSLPPGWQLAPRGEPAPAPDVTRLPASRPVRVRTRSS